MPCSPSVALARSNSGPGTACVRCSDVQNSDGEWPVREPLVLGLPEARVDQDGELVQPRRQRRLEARVLAHRLDAIGELGAAQQHVEGAARAAARSADDGVIGTLLLGATSARARESRNA